MDEIFALNTEKIIIKARLNAITLVEPLCFFMNPVTRTPFGFVLTAVLFVFITLCSLPLKFSCDLHDLHVFSHVSGAIHPFSYLLL